MIKGMAFIGYQDFGIGKSFESSGEHSVDADQGMLATTICAASQRRRAEK